MKDYYYIMGISRDASEEEIKKAYRKLSLKFHPDQNNNDKYWEERFRDINEAYQTLIDSEKRKIYNEELAASNNSGNRYSENQQSSHNQSSTNTSKAPPHTPQAIPLKKKNRAISISSIVVIIILIVRVANCTQESAKLDAENKAIQKVLSDTNTSPRQEITSVAPDTNDSTAAVPDINDSSKNFDNDSTINSDYNSMVTPVPPDITDVYEIKWVGGVTQYTAALIIRQDREGLMRVKYFANGHTNLIEETMEPAHTEEGDCLKGSNPVYAISRATASDYIADNLFVLQDENGNVTYKNVYNGETDICTVTTSTDYSEKQNFLADFEWKLVDDTK